MMVISFTLSLLVTFPELSEIYALPSRGGEGGSLPSLGPHSTGARPLSGAHTNGPSSLSGLNAGSNAINGPNGRHPNTPTVVNSPKGLHVVNPNTPATTTVVHPSNCPKVVHPNGADTTVVHLSNCPSPNTKVTVNSGGSTSSSSSLTVNNVQQQGIQRREHCKAIKSAMSCEKYYHHRECIWRDDKKPAFQSWTNLKYGAGD